MVLGLLWLPWNGVRESELRACCEVVCCTGGVVCPVHGEPELNRRPGEEKARPCCVAGVPVYAAQAPAWLGAIDVGRGMRVDASGESLPHSREIEPPLRPPNGAIAPRSRRAGVVPRGG